MADKTKQDKQGRGHKSGVVNLRYRCCAVLNTVQKVRVVRKSEISRDVEAKNRREHVSYDLKQCVPGVRGNSACSDRINHLFRVSSVGGMGICTGMHVR